MPEGWVTPGPVSPPGSHPGLSTKLLASMCNDFTFFVGSAHPVFPVSQLETFFDVCEKGGHNPQQAFRHWLEYQVRTSTDTEMVYDIVKKRFVAKLRHWLQTNDLGIERIVPMIHTDLPTVSRTDSAAVMLHKIRIESMANVTPLFGGPHATFVCLLCNQVGSVVISLGIPVQVYRHPLMLFNGTSDGVPKDAFKPFVAEATSVKLASQLPGLCDGCSTGRCKLCSKFIFIERNPKQRVDLNERLLRLYKMERLCLGCEAASLLSYRPPKPTEASVSEMVKRFRALES